MSELKPIIPISSAYCKIEPQRDVRHFTFILLPDFSLLAFSAALDPLRITNQLSQRPLYRWTVFSETGEPVVSSSGTSINVDGEIGNLPVESNVFVCSGLVTRHHANTKTLASIRRHARFGGIVGGICTGAVTLAQAGILKSKRVTLHWENQPAFQEEFPDIEITTNLFEIDEKIVTCGGGSASMDLMLHIIKKDYGAQLSGLVADMCLSGTRRSGSSQQRPSISSQIGSRNRRITSALKLMKENIETPLTIGELASSLNSSRRQIERLFALHLQISPSRYYRDLRLDHARGLLLETDLPLSEIMVACGYSSMAVFNKSFRYRFKESPRKFRAM